MFRLSWWKLGGLVAFLIVAAVGIAALLGAFNPPGPTVPANQVWVNVMSAGPTATAITRIDGTPVDTNPLASGDNLHSYYIVPSGATITVSVTALDGGGDIKETTRTLCAIGDSARDELYVTENGYGKGTITCVWTRA